MPIHRRLVSWLRYALVLFVASGFSAAMHECGHYLASRSLGYQAGISFRQGRVETYEADGRTVARMPPARKAISNGGGPAMTMLLGALFTALYLRRRDSFALFALAISSATMRFNMFIDGFNSDEGNVSEILLKTAGNPFGLMVPLTVWTLSAIMACTLISRQKFCSRSYWMIPVFAIITSVCYVLAFLVLGRLETA